MNASRRSTQSLPPASRSTRNRPCWLRITTALIGRLASIVGVADRSLPRPTKFQHENAISVAESRYSVLVIDASPSMESDDWPPSRFDAAKDAAKTYVQQLERLGVECFVAVVAYSEDATLACKLTPIRNRQAICAAIEKIEIGSCTNITAGLTEACRILRGMDGIRQTILLTDGEHTTGRPTPERIASSLRKIATLEVIGIAGSPGELDEDLLKQIASTYPDGSPRYRWIGDRETLVAEYKILAGRLATK